MSEQVFGLGVNQVMAYAAVANVLLVVVLAGINVYYAVHAKRQADASREQVAVFTRQAEIAAETLSSSAQADRSASPHRHGCRGPATQSRHPCD